MYIINLTPVLPTTPSYSYIKMHDVFGEKHFVRREGALCYSGENKGCPTCRGESQNVGKHMSFDQMEVVEVGVSLSRCDIRHDKW